MNLSSLIRRYSGIPTIAAVCAAIIAAPYLIPENPDSPVFRSGVFAALLLIACIHPVYHACIHATPRMLISGMIWGFLFSTALGVGSELFFYNGLLPGMGSMIRRLAVPVLITPLLACLCARLMLLRPASARKGVRRIPFAVFMGVILFCWLPVLLAYWPGMLNYDALGEYMQHVENS